jgi:hypothetical protein
VCFHEVGGCSACHSVVVLLSIVVLAHSGLQGPLRTLLKVAQRFIELVCKCWQKKETRHQFLDILILHLQMHNIDIEPH